MYCIKFGLKGITKMIEVCYAVLLVILLAVLAGRS